jgi:hypothetical protein
MVNETETYGKSDPQTISTPTQREQQLGMLLLGNPEPCVRAMVRRWLGFRLSSPAHPTSIDDITEIADACESFDFLNLEDMRGFCHIWDKIYNSWEHISKLHSEGDRRGLKQFLKEIADPYCTNQITGDYSSSVYGK